MANKILGFGTSATNELTDAAYAADAQRLSGNVPGVARSSLVNKVLHQTSVIAAGVAQYLADRQSADIVDTLTPAQVAALLTANLPNPVVGSSRNLRAIQTAANASLTITADEIVVKNALGAGGVLVPSLNKTINVSTVGANGMDTGLAPVSGWVAIYAIWNPTTGVSALLGVDVTALTAPEVYGGVNMPAGYTFSALASIWPTTAARLLDRARQLDRDVYFYRNVYSSVTAGFGTTSLSIASAVPRNATRWRGNLAMTSSIAQVALSAAVGPTIDGTANPGYVVAQTQSVGGAGVVGGTIPDSPIFTAQTTFFSFSTGGGTSSLAVNSYGYSF